MAHILRVSEDFIPVTEFTAQAGKWLARTKRTGQPIVILRRGRAAAVLLAPAEYDRLTAQARVPRPPGASALDARSGSAGSTGTSRRGARRERKGLP